MLCFLGRWFAKWLPEVFAPSPLRFFNYAYSTLIAGTGGYSFDKTSLNQN